jgi:hypothetical protein
MQIPEKKSSVNARNINQLVKEELYNSKFIKSALYLGAGVLGLFALGIVFKVVNYTADNFKKLNATLKR